MTNVEDQVKKLPYPKSVFFIVSNEFCERFSYYGMKAVLTLFLKKALEFTEDEATEIYHAFGMLCYFTPVFGAMIADSFLGKFRTIFYLSVVYALGNIVLSVAATPPLNNGSSPTPISMIGLLLIAIGTGGIKPCVSAFGGDQFVLPQQALQLATFFSIFYFSINAGSLISTFITPIMRKTQCFDSDCYTLAFSVPAVLMVVSLLVFLAGKRYYKVKPPEGNIVSKVVKCISHAISRSKSGSEEKREHWLDYADDVYDRKLIDDIKVLLRILVLYLPLPVFWALFDQQGSTWTFQATRMDGYMFGGWTLLPDQMQIVNPLLILLLIPVFDQIIYPCLTKIGVLKKPLQRLTCGLLLAGIAFVISGLLELHLETTYPLKLMKNESTLHFVNEIPCSILVDVQHNNLDGTTVLHQKPVFQHQSVFFKSIQSMDYEISLKSVDPYSPNDTFNCKNLDQLKRYTVSAKSEEGLSLLISLDSKNQIQITQPSTPDRLEKSEDGKSFFRFIFSDLDPAIFNISLSGSSATSFNLSEASGDVEGKATVTKEILPGEYKVFLHYKNGTNFTAGTVQTYLGGSYVASLAPGTHGEGQAVTPYRIKLFTTVEPNSVHMLWLLPQYIIMTVAEVMFSVTGLEFSYSQAPTSMKSVIQAAWLLTVAFGNLIVLIITVGTREINEQWKKFFLFAGLIFVDMFIFIALAYFYKPAKSEEEKMEKEEELKSKPSTGTVNPTFQTDGL
ncbi:unnamed protein product [Allacma fusca]|uniref:Oligopeptide transporter 1 n=1 Tax=Allacma fusca TaxID=39272 RepID=A0A8J2PHV5_9HEXA|nr:unnamed protein product [Allacma fusca]